jgi:deoxyribodipyrimidine photolyase-related protein
MNLVLFPNNIYEKKYLPKNIKCIYLMEDPIFFGYRDKKYKFNKIKLYYHRITMKIYEKYLIEKKYKVHYVEFHNLLNYKYKVIDNIDDIYMFDINDHLLKKRLNKILKNIKYLDNPNFVLKIEQLDKYNEQKNKASKYFHKNFYEYVKNELDILVGIKSFDTENRSKIPNNILENIPSIPKKNIHDKKLVSDTIMYIEKYFKKNYGNYDNLVFPETFSDAKIWVSYFLSKKFNNFGVFQDAIIDKDNFLFHSTLSPMLNIGMLSPDYVIDETIKYAKKHKIKMNNVEGFIRQIIGWREYQRYCYLFCYDEMKYSNLLKHNKKLTNKWYDGTTNIIPVDDAIKFAFKYGYINHISRLMIMSNFMNLCCIHPDECYKWFMEFSIDSYDWVMIQNVYSMGQWSDGGLTMRKPYISSSNYILNMSNYKKNDWCIIWNALFYYFISSNKTIIEKTQYKNNLFYWNKLNDADKTEIIKISKSFIKNNCK